VSVLYLVIVMLMLMYLGKYARIPDLQKIMYMTFIIIRIVIPVVFIIKLDWSVCTCLTQLYDGKDMYTIY